MYVSSHVVRNATGRACYLAPPPCLAVNLSGLPRLLDRVHLRLCTRTTRPFFVFHGVRSVGGAMV